MNCLRCRAPVDLSARACSACGTLLDADGDGVPDVLAQMVEDKARALLASERAREIEETAATAARAERAAAAELARVTLANDRASLEDYRERLAANRAKGRGRWYVDRSLVSVMAVAALLVGVGLLPACGEPVVLGQSLLAGRLLCPEVCPGCRGPGRVFTWQENESDVATQLCHNDVVDIDRLRWADVDGGQDKELKPFRLSLWTSVPIDFALVFVGLFAVLPFFAARVRKRRLDDDLVNLELMEAHLGQKVALADPVLRQAGAYRT
ncbi:MAG: hypothetical protein ABIP89_15590 [Polyangiaceae bacterium]